MQTQLNTYIDHTLLKPEASADEIRKLCQEAVHYQFSSVCVLPYWTRLAGDLLKGSTCKLCSVVGFPLGANTSEMKAAETHQLSNLGVHELDMVINIGALKSEDYDYVRQDIASVVQAAPTALIKVILETCLLTDEEKRLASQICVDAGAHFVKTSTGFSKSGATVHDVTLLRANVGPQFGVKASGGIRDYATALAMIKAGANRLGTSMSVDIILEITN